MKFEITQDEKDAINAYKSQKNSSINRLLMTDIETEILTTEENYVENDVIQDINIIKKIYEAMIKNFHNNPINKKLIDIFDDCSDKTKIMPIINILGIEDFSDNIDISQELNEDNKNELYENIIKNVQDVNFKITEAINLDEENSINYENIRKLEQLLAKHNFAMEQENYEIDTTEEEKQNDLDDINRINAELESLKDISVQVFNKRLESIKSVSDWKKNIILYLKNEFKSICLKYKNLEETKESEEKPETLEKIEYKPTGNPEIDSVKSECLENIAVVETLLKNIKDLITKQQNYARIAEEVDSNYKALNNAFEMKNFAEELDSLVKAISEKVDTLTSENKEELDKISKTSVQISVLLNYLNNAKSGASKNITRFDEVNIIEENELKKGIAERIKNIRCEAELKKLRDDASIIEDKSGFKKFIGKFTGRNKLDETILDQIEIRKNAVRKTFKGKMPLAYNYSIHELIAEIQMFIKENEDDELVIEDVNSLRKIKNTLKKNFVIIDSRVISIIDKKTGKNLPLTSEKIRKKELIEIDTYRFLNRYGYDKYNDKKEPEYQDTLANEIKRIIDYIKSSGIL